MTKPATGTTCLLPLQHREYWQEYLAYHAERHPRRTGTKADFEALLPMQRELAATVLSGRYRLGEPRPVLLNRLDGRRKRLVHVYPRQDELVLKLSCRLANRYDSLLPDGCHAFRPGRSARTAFAALMKKPGLDKLACIRLDITDFFNAIPPEKALEALPEAIRQDMPLYALLKDTVLAQASTSTDGNRNPADTGGCHGNATGTGVRPGSSLRTGVRPGTPVAPLLANHYLAAFDRKWMATGWPYARYSDDIILFVPPDRMLDTQARMAADLSALGLSLNDTKSHMHQAGEAWEFLGFSYDHGCIDLCDAAVRKIKNRVRRLARRLNRYRTRRDVPRDKILFYFFRRMNGRLFGYEGRNARFCWSRWYMPLLNTARTLHKLDQFIEEQARYACTGRIRMSDRHRIPRTQLKAAGFRTLVSFFYNRDWVLPQEKST
jgi:hypothetical protein